MKTSTLTGAALDKAVALALNGMFELGARRTDLKFVVIQGRRYGWGNKQACGAWAPSTDWSQGGPLIERERIQLHIDEHGNDFAIHWIRSIGYGPRIDGPTPLIAAMRCFVSSRVSDTVEVPDELA